MNTDFDYQLSRVVASTTIPIHTFFIFVDEKMAKTEEMLFFSSESSRLK